MSKRLGRAGFAALVVAGGVLVAPATASAAPKACALGTWKVSKHTFTLTGDGLKMTGSGGKGTKLTISAKSLKYDFSKSTKVVGKGTGPGGEDLGSWGKYTKTMTVGGAFKGKKSGTFALRPKTAKGSAVVRGGDAGSSTPTETYNLAKSLRAGNLEPIIPFSGKFTCGKKSLHQWYKYTGDGGTIKVDVWFKR
ncbi:hypothetical protein [Actinocorallia sp. A-T 12471]|uniref:hypothetical protein n=1 Tax=Actinocorallia sp. A-T 12471 TaxID=3089813 RepID=UPI0029CBFFBF|nr:hypothetical protein [Actinocorallia sp. A-T 12471]MDX6738336.1 hypothetical protein [Actinocorallia sp. A-T 12471]